MTKPAARKRQARKAVVEGALRNMARAENAATILLASRIARGQLEIMLHFAAAFGRIRDARRVSKMINEISDLSQALTPAPATVEAVKRKDKADG